MLTLLQIGATWCRPCKVMRPVAQAAAEAAGAEYRYADVDDNDVAEIADTLKSVPTFIVTRDGVELDRFVGTQTQQWIEDTLNEHNK